MRMIRFLLICIGSFGVLDTCFISTISSLNLGVLLPGVIGAPLLLLGLLLPRLQALSVWPVIKWAVLICYTLAFIAFGFTWIIIDREARQTPPQDLDVLIVLGAGVRGDRPTRVLRERLETAYAYLDANPGTIAVLSGGKGSGETVTEASAMARYMEELGMDPARLLLEEQASNTLENLSYSYEMIEARWGKDATIGMVTTDFHCFRAGRVARGLGIPVHAIAARDSWYLTLNNHLRECVAIWMYALRGDI